jgi:SulP family sulfate permease
MIGQSMINIKSGARGRTSGVVAALFLLLFILFDSSLIERIPIAALVGVMFVVVVGTISWNSLRIVTKVPRSDALVMVFVAGVTVATDLAIAVLAGVIVSALVFAWKTAHYIYVDAGVGSKPYWRVYNLHGQLCFASVSTFKELFNPILDPNEVAIDFKNARVWDHSGMEAIVDLARRYERAGKKLHLLNLSENCQDMLQKANIILDKNAIAERGFSHRVTVSGLAGGSEGH